MTDMPPRWEEELDSVTLHNQALCSMDMSPTQGFHKLQFLMQQSTYPQETLQNLLILYCKHGYHDLASDVISTYSPVKDKYLSNVKIQYKCLIGKILLTRVWILMQISLFLEALKQCFPRTKFVSRFKELKNATFN